MKDLALDLDLHDLLIENYDLALVDELDAVKQALRIRLQFFYGEWFLDTSMGVKLYDVVFIKNPNLRLVASMFKAVIMETPDVYSMLDYKQEFDRTNRSVSITFTVNTTFGLITDTVEVAHV